jgi:hypothetical protein
LSSRTLIVLNAASIFGVRAKLDAGETEGSTMKRYLAGLAAALSFAALAALPASAIDAQPGGGVIGGAVVTVGQDVTDANDQTIDRCECDGGPLEAVVVNVEGGGTDTIRIDRIVGLAVRTSDGVDIGRVGNVTNLRVGTAIVATVMVDEGVLGTVERIAVRRTAFYIGDGVLVIETSLADLRSSVLAAAAAGA